jgi:uncharacterized protein (DUF952 family)/uncharacterized protein (DUF1330 family)
MLIYKIFRASEWAQLRNQGATQGAPIDIQDGFVHFSTAAQAQETATKHFAAEDDLTLLAIDTLALGNDLKWEPSRGGQLFPHLYRELRLEDVEWVADLPLRDGLHVFPRGVLGTVDPTRSQFDAFKALDRNHPIEMLNLVRFKDQASYPADHPLAQANLTGAQAYGRYGAETRDILSLVGGSIIWRGQFETVLIGPDGESWDAMFIARYPDAHAFLQMLADPGYKKAVVHRQAAVSASRLIRCTPTTTTGAFE